MNDAIKKRAMDAIKADTTEQGITDSFKHVHGQGGVSIVGEIAEDTDVREAVSEADDLLDTYMSEDTAEIQDEDDAALLQELMKKDKVQPEKKEFRAKKVSGLGARFYLWRLDKADALRNLFKKNRAKDEVTVKTDKAKATNTAIKKAKKDSRAVLRQKAREATNAEREKLYNQFVNRLIMLLINGIAVGGLGLAAVDYIVNAQIPERSPLVLGVFFGITLYCTGYWWLTYKKGKGIEGVRGMAVFALVICLIGTGIGGFDVYKNKINLDSYFSGERIVIKDKKETANIIAGYIDTWRHTPNYSLVRISDTAYYATVYNSNGESITQLVQDGDTSNDTVDQSTGESTETIQDLAVCLRDSTAVIVTKDMIERRRDVDNLRYVELAYQWAAKGKANIERVSPAAATIPTDVAPADAMPGTEYAVIIKGLPKIREFYSTVLGEQATTDMLKSLTVAGSDIELRFHVSIAESYIGVAAAISVDGEDNLLWFIDNYTEVYDWSLGDTDWYKYDYQDASKNEKMIQAAVYNATSMLSQFGVDSGLAYTETGTSDTSETDTTQGED